ncbi:MAG: DUF2523 domain-containing protein [Flavobacteriales bacterium]|nr:DUF2523 domain-containing protein [Flavobacteriales bacterium]
MPVPLIAGFFAGLWAFVKASALPMLFYLLGAIGIGVVTYVGMDLFFTTLLNEISSRLTGLPADMVAIFGLLKLDVAIQIIFASYAAALTFKGFKQGAKSVFTLRNPSA